MLSGGHYTGVVYSYILSITCINSTICDAEWWPLYWCGLLLYIKYYLYKLLYVMLSGGHYRCGLLYIKYYLYKLYYM